MPRSRRTVLAAVCAVVALVTAGCSLPGSRAAELTPVGAEVSATAGGAALAPDPAVAVPAPGPFTGPSRNADLLVAGRATLPPRLVRRVAGTAGVDATELIALAGAPVGGRMVTLGAVDPTSYRRFTPQVAATADAVWQRVAEGDLAASPALADELDLPLGGELVIGSGGVGLRVGAHASLSPTVDAVVNEVLGSRLGMVPGNALLVAVDGDPAAVAETLRGLVDGTATVSTLTDGLATEGSRTAFLTGGSVADAVGSFSYRYFDDGTVEPDPEWVAAHLRTESVPILGTVTCHRVMLPQLRAALEDVVAAGLAHLVDAGDFGGCYAPRFIAHDPAKGLSLHTWGIAVDLNVQGNLRGTTGEIDRRVVDIFKRWGFAWGGDWSYTDPMHFELAALVEPR